MNYLFCRDAIGNRAPVLPYGKFPPKMGSRVVCQSNIRISSLVLA